MSKTYEVEIKTLLGEKEKADQLRQKLINQGYQKTGEGSQLNHYFEYTPDDFEGLLALTSEFLDQNPQEQFENQLQEAKKVSIRTRQADGKVYFVAKLSVGDDSSANGILRHEVQEEVDMTLEEIDKALLAAGLQYQAKWSREREEFESEETDFYITIDKNAGYGYLAEFELEVKEENQLSQARERIISLMNEFDLKELDQGRLDRMFSFYNKNWAEYYGTEKVFTVE
jgi:adenylate cyclase class IV